MNGSARSRVSSAFVCSRNEVVEHRLHFAGDAELDAGDRQHDVDDVGLRGEVRRQPPVRPRWSGATSPSWCRGCRRADRTPCRRATAPVGRRCRRESCRCAPPSALVRCRSPVIVPSASNEPLSGVSMTSASGRPVTVSGPRVMVKLICASDSNFEIGLAGLPERLRGACASSASRIAVMAIGGGRQHRRRAGQRLQRWHRGERRPSLLAAKPERSATAHSSAASRRQRR